jgi:flagellar biosynthesis chaperone FliJ
MPTRRTALATVVELRRRAEEQGACELAAVLGRFEVEERRLAAMEEALDGRRARRAAARGRLGAIAEGATGAAGATGAVGQGGAGIAVERLQQHASWLHYLDQRVAELGEQVARQAAAVEQVRGECDQARARLAERAAGRLAAEAVEEARALEQQRLRSRREADQADDLAGRRR